jgi:hypothetical protein
MALRTRIDCARCGKDCTHGYVTFRGWPFHSGCLPDSNNGRKNAVRRAEHFVENDDGNSGYEPVGPSDKRTHPRSGFPR